MRLTKTSLLPSLVLLSAVVCNAQETSPAEGERLLAIGVSAFQAGDNEQARRYLIEARQAGLNSDALTYNLGVVSYQLARYDDARREFRSLLNTPHSDLARYNLGLIALARSNVADARDIFLTLSTESQNPKIRGLAARQLERLSDARPEQSMAAGLEVLLLVGAGYDSNVDQLPDATASGSGDAYSDALIAMGSDFDGFSQTPGAWFWRGIGYHQRFPGNPEDNISLLEGELGKKIPLAAVDLEATLFTQHWWLESDRVESFYGIRTSALRTGCGVIDRCYARLEMATVSGGPDYQEYDGWQYDIEAGLRQAAWGGVFGVELGLGLADRDDIREIDYVASVSPFRQRIELSWRREVAESLTLTGKTAFRHSDYQGDFQWQADGGDVSEQREDERWSVALLADWQVIRDWFVSSELLYESNESTLGGYDYDRYTLWLGVGKTF